MNETDVGREGTGEPLTQQESEAMTRVLGWYGSMRGTYVLFYQEVDDLRLAGYAALQERLEAAEAVRDEATSLLRDVFARFYTLYASGAIGGLNGYHDGPESCYGEACECGGEAIGAFLAAQDGVTR